MREEHGMYGTPEYLSWGSMKQRCLNPKSKAYRYYGARGISVCQEWQDSFSAFYQHMGPRPPLHTLERMNNDKGYEPDNCCWATTAHQSRNKRRNITLEYQGKVHVAMDWAVLFNIPKNTFLHRISKGWPIEKAIVKDGHPTCERGHPWDGIHKRGGRFCRACRKIWDAGRRARRKAAQLDLLTRKVAP